MNNSSSKYECFNPTIYDEIKSAIAKYLMNIPVRARILDIGPYEGNLEEFIDGFDPYEIDAVDIDSNAIEVLKAKRFSNITLNALAADANSYLQGYDKKVDLILSSASMHEINDSSNQPAYLDWFFKKASEILNPGGVILIGDFYFPDWVSDEEVETFRLYQLKTINHADKRQKFVKPELIDKFASKYGFRIGEKKEIRAVKEIDRRYYVLVFRKL